MSDTHLVPRQVPNAVAGCNILVVDDSRTHRKLVEASLRQAGFRCLAFAVDGQQALDAVQAEPPDLVLLDLVMPVLDGFDVCQALRRQPEHADLPVVVMTSLESVEHRLRALSAGATDVILKPVYQPQLVAHTISHLERRLLIRGLRDYQERVAAELATARGMQEALLPDAAMLQQIRERYDINVAAVFEPSAELGGDIWGVWPIDASRLGIFVCDVSGHGTIAAINTFRIHTILMRNDFDRSEPGRFLTALNDRVTGLLSPGQYATMMYAVVDTRRETLSYAAAGCPEPILLPSAGSIRGLDGSGLPVGIVAGMHYPTRYADFPSGSSLVLHSDAFTEARVQSDGALLGEERARALVSEALAGHTAQEVVSNLFASIRTLAGNTLDDDLTLICITRPPAEIAPVTAPAQPSQNGWIGRVLAFANTLSQRLTVKRAALTIGLDADGASDLAAAGRLLADNPYNAIVVDLRLPQDEILELFRTIAGTRDRCHLVLAGVPSNDLIRQASSLGLKIGATLPVTFEAQQLVEALRTSLSVCEPAVAGERHGGVTEADLARALASNDVSFSFQPQVALATGQIIGAEALARWTSPQHGIVSSSVLSVLAKGSTAYLLADAALCAAAAACARWRSTTPSIRVAVNLSAASLSGASFPALVETRLQEAGLPPSALVIEVPEADASSCIPILANLNDLGVCVTLDEFGSGDTSLLTMERLPIRALKLGRSLVQRCGSDPQAMRMLSSTLAIARTLGLTVGAVGIETYALEQTLRAAGCDIGQGWLYGPALSPPSF